MPTDAHAPLEPQPDIAGAPPISVIVRSTDRPTLAATLDSIATQSGTALEVVVVNAVGPAHRPLPARCGTFAMRLTAAPGQPLRRAAAANAGLAAARASRVIFLDDDDLFLPGHLAKLAGALDSHPRAVAACTGVALGRGDAHSWQTSHQFDSEFDALRLRYENFLPIHAVLVERAHSAAVAACRFDESFDLFEDWDFWLQLASLGEFVHVGGVSALYVEGGDGTSGVFAESAAAQAARSRLFEKWRQRASAADHEALLQRAQAEHRELGQLRAHLAQARVDEANLRAILAAREAEIAALGRHATELVAAQASEVASLQALVAARELELANGADHARDLQQLLAARDAEIGNARRHIDGLTAMLQARDDELAGLKAELTRLQHEGPIKALARALRHKLT